MQMEMLNIICSYLYGDQLDDDELLKIPSAFLDVFPIDEVTKNALLKEATKLFGKKAPPTFNDKQHILGLLNAKDPSIYSIPIESLEVRVENRRQVK